MIGLRGDVRGGAWRSAVLICAAAGWLLCGAATAIAADADTLRNRLAAIEAEIESLEQQRDEAAQTWERDQSALQSQRRELAARLLDASFDRVQLEQSRGRVERELRQGRDEVATLADGLEGLMRRLTGVAERIDLHLAESPDRETFEATSADDIRLLNEGDWRERAERASRWVTRFEQLHRRAGQVRVTRTEVHTADGSREAVELLSVGRVAYAYRTVDGGRLGMAVASPAEATGYRWVESIHRNRKRQLAAVFDDAAAGGSAGAAVAGAVHRLPMDVTGQVRAETALQETGLQATVLAGGLVMIPLGLVALLAVLLIVERWFTLHRAGRGGDGLAAAVFEAYERGDADAAVRRCQASDGVVARVLLACLSRREQGQHAMEDGIQAQLLHEAPRLERFLAGIAVLGAVSPLLGLLGTVTGIIQTFEVITTFGNVQPGAMAGGISEALITTAAGLVIAIPILLLHSALSGKSDRIISDAEKHAATMLNLSQARSGEVAGAVAVEAASKVKVEPKSKPKAAQEQGSEA
ncbi:MotA/TolQ/ExbB proton channel family protein [Phycisphaerales bacterium AB-hyl4]|uniref:MotA/TolQ/ExbB proton channel family protein n=1 Tax=Natronomicrosphaera hydrolytica TaxID=3242702 RepID=A0ABV4UA22_9BACT